MTNSQKIELGIGILAVLMAVFAFITAYQADKTSRKAWDIMKKNNYKI